MKLQLLAKLTASTSVTEEKGNVVCLVCKTFDIKLTILQVESSFYQACIVVYLFCFSESSCTNSG